MFLNHSNNRDVPSDTIDRINNVTVRDYGDGRLNIYLIGDKQFVYLGYERNVCIVESSVSGAAL